MLFNRILKATLSFWRLRVEADMPKKKISQIYSSDKDCKFWAGLLLRNVVYLLSFIAPGYQKASNPMTSCLVYCVALWDYLGENLDFNMDRIMIMREEYLKKHHSNILIYRPQISFFPSLSLNTFFCPFLLVCFQLPNMRFNCDCRS